MAYTTINKSTDYFNTKLYTGTGSSNAQTGVGFQPDWLWIKRRSATNSHHIVDAVRGVGYAIASDLTNAQYSSSVSSFDSDGFTVTSASASVNAGSSTYAAWNWKANGAGSANTDGTINSTVSANTTAGFSIVKFTGSGANATVGHGLGVAPKMYILKRIDGGTNAWLVYHDGLDVSSPQNYRCVLNQSTARQDMTTWNDTAPTNSVFSVGSDSEVNGSGQTYIVYCFAEKTGYSKFGSYTGNGQIDDSGTFVYTGFKPAWVMVRRTNTTGDWAIFDNKRNPHNVTNTVMYANYDSEDDTNTNNNELDFLSNGFKLREDNNAINASGDNYIFMAFGQSIVGSNNVPAVAR